MWSGGGLEDDDGDLPRRLLLVLGEAGHHLLLLRPDLLAFVALRDASSDTPRLVADLDRRLGVGDEVEVPGGMRRGAGLRREDHDLLATWRVHERVDPLRTRL